MNMESALPSGKMTAAGAVGTATLVILEIINHYVLKTDPLDAGIMSGIVLVATFLGGYIKSPTTSDVAVVKGA